MPRFLHVDVPEKVADNAVRFDLMHGIRRLPVLMKTSATIVSRRAQTLVHCGFQRFRKTASNRFSQDCRSAKRTLR
ncbi:hypothetical protein PAMC26510_07165 [Caballeronia sordidicola]|uniref:Uncharacterized protein n=1 Tax=Caballeronia sordidicola TaxID=196367 RepID=A0A242N4F3_CABSO|nr:hypothetical protein PAMC26510_07165 [Caballeronia sordidicola]